MRTIKTAIDYVGELWGAVGWILLLAGAYIGLALERV